MSFGESDMSAFGVHFSERVSLFIDGPSLFATSRELGFDIDYRKLIAHFEGACRFNRANYYTLLPEGDDYSPVRPLVDWLDYNGFTVTVKPLREFATDDNGRRKVKGSIAVELAVDLIIAASAMDHCIVISGEGELAYAVKEAQRQNSKITVVSSLRTSPVAISEDLRRATGRFIELETLRDVIGKPLTAQRAQDNGVTVERRTLSAKRQ
jgi:uncharacterized LabA/DUF88 family protein